MSGGFLEVRDGDFDDLARAFDSAAGEIAGAGLTGAAHDVAEGIYGGASSSTMSGFESRFESLLRAISAECERDAAGARDAQVAIDGTDGASRNRFRNLADTLGDMLGNAGDDRIASRLDDPEHRVNETIDRAERLGDGFAKADQLGVPGVGLIADSMRGGADGLRDGKDRVEGVGQQIGELAGDALRGAGAGVDSAVNTVGDAATAVGDTAGDAVDWVRGRIDGER